MKAGYSLVKEHATYFEISHPKDGVFKVAKKPLDQKTMKEIRKLPKAMADGGEVEAPDVDTPDPAALGGVNLPLSAMPMPGNLGALLGQTYKPSYDPNATIAPSASAVSASPGELDALKMKLQGEQTAADAAPQVPELLAAPPAQTAATAAPQDNYVQDVTKAVGQQKAGIQAAANAQQQGANDTAKIYQDQAKTLADVDKDYQTKLQAIDKENQQLQNDITNTKIDPSRVWNSTSTGNKVIAAIGIALSGIGSGLTGQQNMAMKVINDTIDRDIDAQKADLGKKQNLLAVNLQKYGRLDAAVAATRANLLSTVQAQVGGIAAKTQGAVAQANAQQLIGQLGLQTSQLMHGIAQQSALDQYASGGAPLSPQIADKLYPGRWVEVPGAGIKVARTKEGAEKVAGVQASAATFGALLGRMEDFAKKAGTAGTFSGSDANAEANSLRTQALLQIKELGQLGALSKSDIEDIIQPMLPEPGSMRSGRTTKQISQLRQMTTDKVNAFYGANLIGYNPGGIAFKAK